MTSTIHYLIVGMLCMGLFFCSSAKKKNSVKSEDKYIYSGDFVAIEVYPELILRAKVAYPYSTKIDGLSGTVYIAVLVTEDGNVNTVQLVLSSGVSALDNAALDAARRCRFKPGIHNGEPVMFWTTLSYEFPLDEP